MSRRTKKPKKYIVVGGTSTRASLDPEDPGFETWIDFHPGDVVTAWPAHAPVDEWVESGHWQDPDAPAAAPAENV